MGKMKEIFIEQQEELNYRGAHDAMIHGLCSPSNVKNI